MKVKEKIAEEVEKRLEKTGKTEFFDDNYVETNCFICGVPMRIPKAEDEKARKRGSGFWICLDCQETMMNGKIAFKCTNCFSYCFAPPDAALRMVLKLDILRSRYCDIRFGALRIVLTTFCPGCGYNPDDTSPPELTKVNIVDEEANEEANKENEKVDVVLVTGRPKFAL